MMKRLACILLSALLLSGTVNLNAEAIGTSALAAKTSADAPVSNNLCYGSQALSVSEADETTDLRALAVERGLLTDTYSFPNHAFSLSDEDIRDAFNKEVIKPLESDYFLNAYGVDEYSISALFASGLCYGISATTVLAHNGVISPDELQRGASSLHDIELADDVECLIGQYSIPQLYPELMHYLSFLQAARSYDEQISVLLETAERCEENGDYFEIGIFTPNMGHAVVGMGMVNGSWEWNDISYDTCILVNDSNLVDEAGKAVGFHESGCIYVNSETLQFYIPCYDAGTENGSIIGYVTDDTQLLSYRAPLHEAEYVEAFEESARYSKLRFWGKDGSNLPDILVSYDSGLTYSPGEILNERNMSEVFSDANSFYIDGTKQMIDLSIYGPDYVTRIECFPGCEIKMDEHQIVNHNVDSEQNFSYFSLAYESQTLNADFPRKLTGAIFLSDYLVKGETQTYRLRENGFELTSTEATITGNFICRDGHVEYIYLTGSSDTGTRVLFGNYDEKQQMLEQYLDLDNDGIYETKIEKGDANGDGIPFRSDDAQITLRDYLENTIVNGPDDGTVNLGIADMDGDRKITAADAQMILLVYLENLVG